MVTDQGVWVCPILVNEPSGRMGERLADTLGDFPSTTRHAGPATSTGELPNMTNAHKGMATWGERLVPLEDFRVATTRFVGPSPRRTVGLP